MDKEGPYGVDIEIIQCILYGIFTGAKGHKHRPSKQKYRGGQYKRHDKKGGGTVSEYFFSGFLIALSHHNRGAGRPSHTDQGSKGGYNHDNGHGHPDGG